MQVGQIVTILPRSHPGINRCGGTAFITRIHTDSNDENNPGGKPTKIDVKYVLGGKESGIELTYVREDVSSMSATTATSTRMAKDKRERKQDVKMNMGEWGGGGGQKKRVALGDVDGNCGSRKRGKKEVEKKQNKKNVPMTNAELSGGKEEHGGLPEGSEMDGEWIFIKSGKISSYLPYLTATTRIQYWWNHEDGWLHATILKSIHKVVTSKIIKWVVKVEFEDGEKASLTFHPGDKRWKVKIGPVDKKTETKEDGGKGGRKRGGMPSEKKIKKSPANPASNRKNDEKKVGKKSSAKAGSGGSEPVESNAQASGGADDCHAVEMSKPTDLGLLVKNDNTKPRGSRTTVNMSKPTDLGLLVKKDSARASGSGRTMKMKTPIDSGLLVKNDSARASSSGIVNKDEPTDLDLLIKNDKARACSSGGTITMSKRTDLGLLVKKNRGGACSTGAGTVAMSKPNDFGLLTKNVSTKASNTGDGPAKKSKPVSVTLDARGTVFKKETNRDTPASTTKTKQTDNKNTTPFAKKKELVPTIDNVYKSDKSTINTVTPFHHATQKKASASNRAASFSFPSNTQSKLKEVASKMTKETEESNASSLAQRIDGLEAARVKAASKKKSSRPRSYVDLTAEPAGEKKSEAKTIPKEESANSSRPMTLTETLYEKESTKAEEFVNHMKRRDEGNVAKAKKPSASSPGGSVSSSSASGELVVKVDDQRKELFKAGVYQVMTRLHVEKMDVEELITKVNAYSSSQNQEPFTPLEARAYLQHLDTQNNVFMVWDEGKSGVVYPF
eukprot:CCRYP_014242-RA/>CCRYP_014242-RA protein AED:0.06 eAED:0.06 QI:414/1/1/1/1/1/3/578/785